MAQLVSRRLTFAFAIRRPLSQIASDVKERWNGVYAVAAQRAALTAKRRALASSEESCPNGGICRNICAPMVGYARSANPPDNLKSFSALPWAMRSLSAALTGSCSKNARPSAMD
jgi:hypothetical protein